MAKILASIVGKLFTMLAWDGSDFRNLKVNDEGRLEVSIQEISGGEGDPIVPLLWRFDGVVRMHTPKSATAGDFIFTSDTIPTGELWCVTAIAAANQDKGPTRIEVAGGGVAGRINLIDEDSPGMNRPVRWAGTLWMDAGAWLYCKFYGCDANDAVFVQFIGYKILL